MTGTINKIFLSLLLIVAATAVFGQEKAQNSILLTGVVLDAENGEELPYVNVRISDTFYGTATNTNGFFSLFVNSGDTLTFSYVGYEQARFIMPFEVEDKQYALLQLMVKDTLLLEEVVVFSWPDYEDFVEAFLDTKPQRNMDDLIVEVKQDLNQTLEEAERSRYYYEQQRYQRLFIMHEIFPPNNFLDPGRWADFIRDLRNPDKEQGSKEDY